MGWVVRKAIFGVSDQVQHKPDYTVRGLKLGIWEVEGLYYLCCENKDADQLCGYCAADQICAFVFIYMQKADFLMTQLI